MNPLAVVTILSAAVDLWKSIQANQGDGAPSPEYLEAQKNARKAQLALAETLTTVVPDPNDDGN